MERQLSHIIGELIRRFRIKLGLSQEELAHQANTHFTYIGKLERGEKNITIETLSDITKALGMTLEEFFSYFPNEQSPEESTNMSIITNRLKQMDIEERNKFIEIINDLLNWKINN